MAANAIGNIRFDDVRSGSILVALSGGADSVALLCLLHEHSAELSLRLTAAHFHHGIRGRQADEDAQFCRNLCSKLGVPYIEGYADIPRIAKERGCGIETAAREERYAFLRNARKQCGADVIALAHHLNDQAETVLMHLLRGAGPEGACGMARLRDGLYRPLLDTPKSVLKQYLEKRRISWREDASNGISDTPRNALRLNVLPEIEKSYPSAEIALARHARLARIESDFLARLTDCFLSERLQRGPYGMRLLLDGGEEEALLRRALRCIAGCNLPAEKIDALTLLARKKRGKLAISGKCNAERTPAALYFLPAEQKNIPAVELRIPGDTLLEGICCITAELGNFPIETENPFTEILDADALEGACLRTRQNGDRIHPLGSPGEKLLSDYLTDRKIDRPLRDIMPLIACGNRILWAGGTGISQEARIHETTRRRVRLTIKPITDEKPEV